MRQLHFDLPCERCGYNLRGQELTGSSGWCPECGDYYDVLALAEFNSISGERPINTRLKECAALARALRNRMIGLATAVGAVVVLLLCVWPIGLVAAAIVVIGVLIPMSVVHAPLRRATRTGRPPREWEYERIRRLVFLLGWPLLLVMPIAFGVVILVLNFIIR